MLKQEQDYARALGLKRPQTKCLNLDPYKFEIFKEHYLVDSPP